MWYLARFRKDGSLASLTETAEIATGNERQIYIEAASKELAAAKAKKEWASWKTKIQATAASRNLCCECMSRPRKPGIKRCAICADKRQKAKQRRRDLARLPVADRAEATAIHLAVGEANRRAANFVSGRVGQMVVTTKAVDSLERRGFKATTYTPSTILRYVARAFDRDPENFRDWLDKELTRVTSLYAKSYDKKRGFRK